MTITLADATKEQLEQRLQELKTEPDWYLYGGAVAAHAKLPDGWEHNMVSQQYRDMARALINAHPLMPETIALQKQITERETWIIALLKEIIRNFLITSPQTYEDAVAHSKSLCKSLNIDFEALRDAQ